jgi:hypothetical protein
VSYMVAMVNDLPLPPAPRRRLRAGLLPLLHRHAYKQQDKDDASVLHLDQLAAPRDTALDIRCVLVLNWALLAAALNMHKFECPLISAVSLFSIGPFLLRPSTCTNSSEKMNCN